MAKERNQHEERSTRTLRDQHRRRYSAVIEKATGHPVGAIIPLFVAPVMPPQDVLRVDPEDSTRLKVDYAHWLDQAKTAHQAYRELARQVARKIHGVDAARYSKQPSPEMLDYLGDPPFPLELIVACRQGKSRWVLGLPGPSGEEIQMPSWAVPYFPDPEKEAELEFGDFTDELEEGEEDEEGESRFGTLIEDEPIDEAELAAVALEDELSDPLADEEEEDAAPAPAPARARSSRRSK